MDRPPVSGQAIHLEVMLDDRDETDGQTTMTYMNTGGTGLAYQNTAGYARGTFRE
jgi:hypothetical protein